jgi:hypothetical protein
LTKNTTGTLNHGLGHQTLHNNTTGRENVGLGWDSGFSNTTGNHNIAIGSMALRNNITGSDNIAIGRDAGLLITGNNNTIIGSRVNGIAGINNHVIIGDGEGNERIFINEKGYTGIGTVTPTHKLYVQGGNDIDSPNGLGAIGVGSEGVLGKLLLAHAAKDYYFSTIAKKGDAIVSGYTNGSLIISNEGGGDSSTAVNDIKFATKGLLDANVKTRMTINKEGKVIIGRASAPGTINSTESVANYNLFVTGGILSEEVRVSLATNWADYVFNDEYVLKPLAEVESYINENGHLPNVPSAAQVKEEGLELGQMTKIQQEKIEELTLYLIQQQKEIDELKSLVKELVKK